MPSGIDPPSQNTPVRPAPDQQNQPKRVRIRDITSWIALSLTAYGLVVVLIAPIGDHFRAIATLTTEQMKLICRMHDVCLQYVERRNECAVAGSYNTCMSIKFGVSRLNEARNYCNEDGTVLLERAADVHFFDCLFADVGN